MFAIVETGGKQYRVAEGDTIRVEKLPSGADDSIVFDRVLALYKDGELTTGKPYVDGAKAVGTVIKQGKGKKVLVFKYKPKKKYRNLRGHRQAYTQVRIDSIEA